MELLIKETILLATICDWHSAARAILGPPLSATSPRANMLSAGPSGELIWRLGATKILPVSFETHSVKEPVRSWAFGDCPVHGI